jgi:DNA-binding NtrC family response regulator
MARKAVADYHWPGNIRALRHATERAVILSEGDEFTAEDFQLSSAALSGQSGSKPASVENVLQELNLEKLEKEAIRLALKEHRYNISHAAKELGLTRAALYRRMEKHGL